MNKYIGIKLIDAEPAICCNKNFFKSLVLLNDFEVHGQASCVKAENYNIEIGEKFAVEKAKDKIWEVLGFVLQWGINGIKKK